jgi:hypothetical protein
MLLFMEDSTHLLFSFPWFVAHFRATHGDKEESQTRTQKSASQQALKMPHMCYKIFLIFETAFLH